MSEEKHPIVQLLQRDRRYKLEAYQFVRDSLSYAQDVLNMGGQQPTERQAKESAEEPVESGEPPIDSGEQRRMENHLTGQQLCNAIRQYAVEQYGYMAKAVLNSWGVQTTSDFGEIVYNMIDVELMKKSESDRREDFDNVYDFEDAFLRQFEITMPSD